MAFVSIELENLTELKTRVGNSTDTTLARILGIDYPAIEGTITYRWHNTSLDVADDFEIVCPTPRIGLAGRWFRIDNAQIPQVNTDWNSTSGISQLLNKPVLNISNWDTAYSWGNHNTAGYLTENSFSNLTNKTGNISQWTNNVGYLTSIPAQSFSSLTGKPTTIAGYGITDFNSLGDARWSLLGHTHTFGSLTSKPTTLSGYGITDAYPLIGNPSGFISSLSAGTGISIAGTTITNTAPDQTVSITNGNRISTTGTYPNFTVSFVEPTINTAVTRTLNSNFTISTTKQVKVNYSVTCSVTNPLVAGSSTASVFLEYSINGGSTWLLLSQNSSTSSVALAVAVAITNIQTSVLTGEVPANALVRIRSTTSGTASVTYVTGTEIY